MPRSENLITLPGPELLRRAELLPLQPRDQAEAQALPAKLDALRALAAEDGHMVINPTHVMVGPEGNIIGYLSLNGLPVVHAWFDTKHKHVRDSLTMIEHGQTILRQQGVRGFAVACAAESPFTPHLPRLGFHQLGATVLWHKYL
jgi:hypothetical protein